MTAQPVWAIRTGRDVAAERFPLSQVVCESQPRDAVLADGSSKISEGGCHDLLLGRTESVKSIAPTKQRLRAVASG